MPKIASLIALSTFLTSVAAAQSESRIEKPFHVELGAYIPTTGGGIDTNVGGALALGYSFARIKNIEVGASVRGSFFHASDQGVGGDITLTSALATGRFRPEGSKFFGGVGLGAGTADVRTGGLTLTSDTEFVYSAEVGMDFSAQTYALVRYQGSSQRGQRGVTVGVGFRF
jgi:hypothetical protein